MNDVTKREVKVREHKRSDGTVVAEHLRRIKDVISEEPLAQGILAGAAAIAGLKLRGINHLDIAAYAKHIRQGRKLPDTWEGAISLNRIMYGSTSRLSPLNPLTAQYRVLRPDAYKHLQKGTFQETLSSVEKFIKTRPIEYTFTIDRTSGKIISGTRGVKDSAPIIALPGKPSTNYVVTHNHPSNNMPYSGGDLIAQYSLKVPELRAVNPDGTVTRMLHRSDDSIPFIDGLSINQLNQSQLTYMNGRMADLYPNMSPFRLEWVTTRSRRHRNALMESLESDKRYWNTLNRQYAKFARENPGWTWEVLGRVAKKHTPASAMVALLPKSSDVKDLPKGELLHMTISFLGEEIPDDAEAAVGRLSKHLPITARVGGVGTLGDEDPPACVMFFNGKGLVAAREAGQVNGAREQHEPFIPHMTIKYGSDPKDYQSWVGRMITFDRAVLQRGEETLVSKRVDDDMSTSSYPDGMNITADISKLDEDRRQVFGWANIVAKNGDPIVDLQGDLIDIEELEKAAYEYVIGSRVAGEMHKRNGEGPKQIGTLIESFVTTPDKIEKLGLPEDTPHGWWIGFKVDDDEVWKAVKDGKYTAFSIHGSGKREPVEEEYVAFVTKLADESGMDEDEIEEIFKGMLVEEGVEPTDENVMLFAQELEEYEVSKHLIGRHEQKDHGKGTKKKHSRMEHKRGGYGRRFSQERADQLDAIRPEKILGPKKISKQQDWIVKSATLAGCEVDDVVHVIKLALRHKGLSVTPDNIVAAISKMGEPEEFAKHLIGRHDQKDHDPTKKGGGHSRDEHGGENLKRATKIGIGAGAAIGAARFGAMGGAVPMMMRGAIQGGGVGALAGYNLGGGQVFGTQPDPTQGQRWGAGLANATLGGGIWAGGRRLIHGSPDELMERRRRGLSKRSVQILNRYLG